MTFSLDTYHKQKKVLEQKKQEAFDRQDAPLVENLEQELLKLEEQKALFEQLSSTEIPESQKEQIIELGGDSEKVTSEVDKKIKDTVEQTTQKLSALEKVKQLKEQKKNEEQEKQKTIKEQIDVLESRAKELQEKINEQKLIRKQSLDSQRAAIQELLQDEETKSLVYDSDIFHDDQTMLQEAKKTQKQLENELHTIQDSIEQLRLETPEEKERLEKIRQEEEAAEREQQRIQEEKKWNKIMGDIPSGIITMPGESEPNKSNISLASEELEKIASRIPRQYITNEQEREDFKKAFDKKLESNFKHLYEEKKKSLNIPNLEDSIQRYKEMESQYKKYTIEFPPLKEKNITLRKELFKIAKDIRSLAHLEYYWGSDNDKKDFYNNYPDDNLCAINYKDSKGENVVRMLNPRMYLDYSDTKEQFERIDIDLLKEANKSIEIEIKLLHQIYENLKKIENPTKEDFKAIKDNVRKEFHDVNHQHYIDYNKKIIHVYKPPQSFVVPPSTGSYEKKSSYYSDEQIFMQNKTGVTTTFQEAEQQLNKANQELMQYEKELKTIEQKYKERQNMKFEMVMTYAEAQEKFPQVKHYYYQSSGSIKPKEITLFKELNEYKIRLDRLQKSYNPDLLSSDIEKVVNYFGGKDPEFELKTDEYGTRYIFSEKQREYEKIAKDYQQKKIALEQEKKELLQKIDDLRKEIKKSFLGNSQRKKDLEKLYNRQNEISTTEKEKLEKLQEFLHETRKIMIGEIPSTSGSGGDWSNWTLERHWHLGDKKSERYMSLNQCSITYEDINSNVKTYGDLMNNLKNAVTKALNTPFDPEKMEYIKKLQDLDTIINKG